MRNTPRVLVGRHDGGLEISGVHAEVGVRSMGTLFLLPSYTITKLLYNLVSKAEAGTLSPDVLAISLSIVSDLAGRATIIQDARDMILRIVSSDPRSLIESAEYEKTILSSEFVDAVSATNWTVFDSRAWIRGGF